MKYLGLLFCIALVFSCEKDDEPILPQQIIDNGGIVTMAGEWHLESMMTFSPNQMVFEEGDYVWTISEPLNSIDVVQTIDTAEWFIALEGDQSYSLEVQGDSLLTEIYDYAYDFQDSVLFVYDFPEADGPAYRFIRP